MGLRNLPTEEARPLASLIECRPGQVSSMGLTQLGGGASVTLMAFAAGESVSNEAYEGDTLYYLVEGSAAIVFPDGRRALLRAGDALMVPSGQLHAVESVEAFKVMQVTVP